MEFDKNFPHSIKVTWTTEQGTIWWNETCAQVLEVFGLPGHRYMYRPHFDYMTFNFASEKDAIMCKILLSDRL